MIVTLRTGNNYKVVATPDNSGTHICYGIKINGEYTFNPEVWTPHINTTWDNITGQCIHEFTMNNGIHSIDADFVRRYPNKPVYINVHNQIHIYVKSEDGPYDSISIDGEEWIPIDHDQILPAGKYYIKFAQGEVLPIFPIVEGETYDIGGNLAYDHFWNGGGIGPMVGMDFCANQNIIDASKLIMPPPSAINGDLTDYCGLFGNCKLLEHGPILVDGITLFEARPNMIGYQPTLSSNGLYKAGNWGRFWGCSSLKSFTCLLAPDPDGPCPFDIDTWSPSGTFYKKPGVTWPAEFIPEGWEVRDFDMSQLYNI